MVAQQPSLAVVDASVFFKWLVTDEEYIEQATALRDDYYFRSKLKLIAPQLLVYEAVNAIAVATHRNRVSPEKAVEGINSLLALGVELREVPAARILELALKHKLAAYDAAYLALAEDEKCDLWTGDRVFYRAVRNESDHVKWIGDYKRKEGKP